jgi:signal transduction histidine kinase
VRPESHHPVARALSGGASIYSNTSFATLREISESDEHAEFGSALGVRSLMVVPLTARGQTLGAMSFVSLDKGRRYTQADLALASELADRAGIAIDNARLYRQLQESNRLKDEFLGTVSHELRTPLNAVLGWAQILKRTGVADPDQTARAIDAIERNAQAQAQLVEDLLDTSRVVSGKLRITFVPVDLADLVQAAVESLRPLARSRGLDLTLTVGEGLVPIMADAARLQQVIGNLVSNALKFTPPAGRVEVSVRRAGGTMEIAVADTGAGIAPEFLPFVFDRFRQADSTTTRTHGGLGLGLSIARHLVALHGGTIRAESPGEQQGATFTVVLPINPADPPAEAVTPASHPTPDLAGVHVLVVDDQADARALLQTMLGAAGARVDTAASADEARLLIATRRPHLVVSDIGMPREDGYSLIRSVRQADEAAGRERLPSIAVTAYASQDDRLRALGSGYDRHVTKPVDPAALLQTIVALIPPR